MLLSRSRVLLAAVASAVLAAHPCLATAQEPLAKEAMRQFLLNAEIVKSRDVGKGVTRPSRLTLTDGTFTHDAAFQSVDESKKFAEFNRGGPEINFRDTYHYNLAAYAIAELLGLDEMMPVTVERTWRGKRGALSWWVDRVMMDEGERLKKKMEPQDPDGWNRQMFRMRVFRQFVYDTDQGNVGNALIAEGWKLWMIDFTRAFRLYDALQSPGDLRRCDRQLLERLKQLDLKALEERTARHLNSWEIKALMARRDKIVAHFARLVAELGETRVLY